MDEKTKEFLDKINFHRLMGVNKTWDIYDIYDNLNEIFLGLLDNTSSVELYHYLLNRYKKVNRAWFTEEVIYYVKFLEEDKQIGF